MATWLKCKDSARLMSQGLDRSLSGGERFWLQLHLLMCHGCRNARRQLEFIRHACAQWVERGE